MSNVKCSKKGFTLIELMVAIVIIGFLAAAASVYAVKAMEKSRDTRRKADLSLISDALEKYYFSQRIYPSSNALWLTDFGLSGGVLCLSCIRTKPYIPALQPGYLAKLPHDPKYSTNIKDSGYMYRSDSTNYKLVSFNAAESIIPVPSTDDYYDPGSGVNSEATKSYQISSNSTAKAWVWW